MRMQWQVRMHQVPLESWACVVANEQPYGLFLSHRPDSQFWRGFVIAGMRRQEDLYSCRWSPDVLAEHFAQFGERQIVEAQERLVLILAQRLGVMVEAIQPARNGQAVQERRRLTAAQINQMAATQPRRR